MPNKVMLSAGSRPYISVALGGKAPLTVLEDVLKVLCGDETRKRRNPLQNNWTFCRIGGIMNNSKPFVDIFVRNI